MRIGLCGAQGTGKTSLAMAFSQQWYVPYLDANLRNVFGRFNYTLADAAQLPLLDRLMLQESMIDQLKYVVEHKSQFIIDRSFIDIAAYTLAILPYDLAEESQEAVMANRLVERCLRLQIAHFDKTLLLQPGIELNKEERLRINRGSQSWIALDRINSYSHCLLARLPKESAAYVPAAVVDFEKRSQILALFTEKAYQAKVSEFNCI